jgi:hypothetical protein
MRLWKRMAVGGHALAVFGALSALLPPPPGWEAARVIFALVTLAGAVVCVIGALGIVRGLNRLP